MSADGDKWTKYLLGVVKSTHYKLFTEKWVDLTIMSGQNDDKCVGIIIMGGQKQSLISCTSLMLLVSVAQVRWTYIS